MLHLAPEIQQHILSVPDVIRRPAVTERALRPVAQLESHRAHLVQFKELVREDQ